jgi:predicted house-cleaning noncanonical NTP pyrophosphatase (MazG superfamily)
VTRKVYDKLVRDRIPEIIRKSGSTCSVETIGDDHAFRRALRDKLVEEATEAATASEADIAGELADLQEVIETLIEACELDRDALRALQHQRRLDRGGFSNRLRLLWTE